MLRHSFTVECSRSAAEAPPHLLLIKPPVHVTIAGLRVQPEHARP